MPDAHPAYTRLTVAADLMTAQVVAAHLETEGIPARINSESLGPYRLTVGDMATAEIWVLETDLAEASAILSESESVPAPFDTEAADDEPSPTGTPTPAVALLAVVILGLLAYRFVTAVF